ncbi:hypothetical protein [Parabacteroides sp. PF5-9]|uniref:hypothetical protein n=1 Tax=Parabacteroides sp. PF5-9 TaxID=1742404 RepID=UPI00247658AF|nr:hypothetical protein [Parabacteroides sp. PF5-9]MDH6358643.1 hypothetical protein [Parabacteroides sp. PF5-9]
MLTTLLITVIILVICIALLSVKILFKKGGEFPNTHVGGNKTLRKKGIHCAKTQDKEAAKQRNLYDRMKETKK